MSTQKELELEALLIQQLETLGYERFQLRNETMLLENLKRKIQQLNKIEKPFSDSEWKQIWHYLSNETTVFKKAELLRNRCPVKFDDGSVRHVHFISEDVQENSFQVSNQVVADHRDLNGRTSRFDVTLLINGFPLVQIEIKKSGVELKKAFEQTLEYAKTAYKSGEGLFGFIQFFVISNGVNCLYYANGTQSIEFAFPWTDEKNKKVNDLGKFTNSFLDPQHLTKMLMQYVVMHQSTQSLMILRPYQIYAVEKIIEHIKTSPDNAYIWHTTGSGKTLTSFKASQLLIKQPEIQRVIFVVDRKDLDGQTAEEFNKFRENSVDSTTNTANLVKQLRSLDNRLVVTTIQKLNNAISNDRYENEMAFLKDQKVIFIFDECHRSQFGETHQKIKKFFKNAQMFGFTGTPIFEKNGHIISGEKFTTEYLFPKLLYKYVIVDAINDGNVLPFNIDYLGRFVHKNPEAQEEKIESIDKRELFENERRIEKIVREVIATHASKTNQREFNAMFCVSSVPALIQYYDKFEKVQAELLEKAQQNNELYQPLNIATIFSYAQSSAQQASEADDDFIAEEEVDAPKQVDEFAEKKLTQYIANYNQTFNTNYSLGSGFYDYYQNISSRVKAYGTDKNKGKEIDILLVVNMFLTGFDSKRLNTLYVDKNLKHHGLIQAFSRTNRVYGQTKPFGNIVCFRNLKQATDDALIMFSDKEAKNVVVVSPYEQVIKLYESAVNNLLNITPTCQSVDDLYGESEKESFVYAFRDVMRLNNRLKMYSEYDQDATSFTKQDFENYSSKYKDLAFSYQMRPNLAEKTSVLDEVDFQLDLLFSDRVNVDYILKLLKLIINSKNQEQKDSRVKQLKDLLNNNISLYDKRDLIEKFINEQIPKMVTGETVQEAFAAFWDMEKHRAYDIFCNEEQLKKDEFNRVVDNFEFTERLPLIHEIKELPIKKPPLGRKRAIYYADLHTKTNGLLSRFDLKI
ncbi:MULTISPECIES: type I restriction endonuclease subunit R [Acinetobacter calcoaceticus/baumannii complex]|uniref:type I restriction endonuclease subunit R n=1 Tax=Acinetobacter calcoaceticus/baumannii complex TaxID=909768 RepID=UPI000452046E|nr:MULTISPECIES: type I restriction endonuclease subunit R [Acinetobacter calcoaceticus/baumannii complex]EXR42455.1 type-1 restriction enzyme R protein [Acinetobacter sp. 1294243]OCY17420.1 deoxyribonuclease HsdR [Acinetobacter pittii]